MSNKKTKLKKSEAQKKQNRRVTALRLSLLILILFLIIVYILLGIWYDDSKFTITLDSENGELGALIIYEDPEQKRDSIRTLSLKNDMKFFTDISGDWIPEEIDNEKNGSHNGRYYLAYTFYVENSSNIMPVDYWARIRVVDVVKNVDEAIRVKVYKNGNPITYAKRNKKTNEAEQGTTPFYKEDNRNYNKKHSDEIQEITNENEVDNEEIKYDDYREIVMLEQNLDFQAGSVDKYTIVIWVEGDDPECLDDIIGGEIKMKMTITEVLQTKRENDQNEQTEEI